MKMKELFRRLLNGRTTNTACEEQNDPTTKSEPSYIKRESDKVIIIDNGHGRETAGKRSPDGRLMEWAWTRDIAARIVERLHDMGYSSYLLVPEDNDIPLSVRCRRVNDECRKQGATNVLLVSIHNNASSNGSTWREASGFGAYVSLNASVRSMRLAEDLCNAAVERGVKVRKPKPTQQFWEQNLAICRDTNCPAVLTENLFMDNRADVDWLLSEQGKQTIVDLHVAAIDRYILTY